MERRRVFGERGGFRDGIDGEEGEEGWDNGWGDGLNEVKDVGVGVGKKGGGGDDEDDGDSVEFREGEFSFVGFIRKVEEEGIERLEGWEIVREERFEDREEWDDGRGILECNGEGCFGRGDGGKVVREIRKEWNIVGFGLGDVGGRESKEGGKGKEDEEWKDEDGGRRNDLGRFRLGEVGREVFVIVLRFRKEEGREDWGEVKGEKDDGNGEGESDEDRVMRG